MFDRLCFRWQQPACQSRGKIPDSHRTLSNTRPGHSAGSDRRWRGGAEIGSRMCCADRRHSSGSSGCCGAKGDPGPGNGKARDVCHTPSITCLYLVRTSISSRRSEVYYGCYYSCLGSADCRNSTFKEHQPAFRTPKLDAST